MNLSNYFWSFSGVLTPKFCDDVIKYALSKEETMARTGGYGDKKLNKEEVKNLQKKRRSDLVWLNDTWIYKELHPYVHMANKNAGWNFEWSRSESCQFTKYKLNQYYDWHTDPWHKPYQRKDPNDPDNGKVRKLSMRDESKHIRRVPEILPKGSIVVFPSHLWHRVKPVTRGTRYSLVVWHLGYPFK